MNGIAIPPNQPLQVGKALRSLLGVLRDASDTDSVFKVVEALDGGTSRNNIERMLKTDLGRRIASGDSSLIEHLSDEIYLRGLPAGSFGAHYFSFLKGKALDVDGVLASERARRPSQHGVLYPEAMRLQDHFSLTHDLWHILLRYEPEPAGEICMLIVTDKMLKSRGLRLISYMAALKIQFVAPKSNIFGIISEARRLASRMIWLPSVDLVPLLEKPIDYVREELLIGRPEKYLNLKSETRSRILASFSE
jgi:ubiquinone biosynthesis protein COQ4